MTSPELAAAMRTLGWSGIQLSVQLRCGRHTVWAWMNDDATVPDEVAGWLRSLVEAHRTRPPPTVWRTKYNFAAGRVLPMRDERMQAAE